MNLSSTRDSSTKKVKFRQLWKKYANFLKPFLVVFIILGSFELFFGVLDATNQLGEPYEWGSRNDIPFKINEARDLFSTYDNRPIKILIFGDSRAEFDIDPRRIDAFFNDTTISYNLAVSGTANKFQNFLLHKVILTTIKPDFLIWVVSQEDFAVDERTNEQNAALFSLPMARFYNNDPSGLDFYRICDYLLLKTSNIYRSKSFTFFRDQYVYNAMSRGYRRSFAQKYVSPITTMQDLNYSIPFDQATGLDFLSILSYLTTSNINYLIVSPPRNYYHYIVPGLDALYTNLTTGTFLDLNGNLTLAPDIYYYSEGHLNTFGAIACSEFISSKISTRIQEIASKK